MPNVDMFPFERSMPRGTSNLPVASHGYRPPCWLAPLRTAASTVEQGSAVLLLVAPPGHGKSTFLAGLAAGAAAAGWQAIRLVPGGADSVLECAREALGMAADALTGPPAVSGLPPPSAGRDVAPSLFTVDAADSLSDSALRAVLMLPLLAPMTDRTVSVVLSGAPNLARRVESLLPARPPGGLPQVTLPAWSEEDVRGFLEWRLANADAPAAVAADVPARLAELAEGRPSTTAALVSRSLALAAGAAQPLLSRETIESAAADEVAAEAEVILEDGLVDTSSPAPYQQNRLAYREGAAPVRPGGLAEGALQLADTAPATATSVGLIGLFGSPPARTLTSRLRPYLALLPALMLVFGFALWHEWTAQAPPAAGLPGSVVQPPELEQPSREEGTAGTAVLPTQPAAGLPPRIADAPPRPAAAAATAPAAAVNIPELIARGDALMRLADVAAARQFYLLAARRGDVAGLTAAAATFDPRYLRDAAIPGARADPQKAIDLYREAARLGDRQAVERLQALEATLNGRLDAGAASPFSGAPR